MAPGTAARVGRMAPGKTNVMKVAHLVRKPLSEGSVAKNVLVHGTGGVNIDKSRISTKARDDIFAKNPHTEGGFGHASATVYGDSTGAEAYDPTKGRWPSNLVLVHKPGCEYEGTTEAWDCAPDCPIRELDEQSGDRRSAGLSPTTYSNSYGYNEFGGSQGPLYDDTGGASRFFKQVKPCPDLIDSTS